MAKIIDKQLPQDKVSEFIYIIFNYLADALVLFLHGV